MKRRSGLQEEDDDDDDRKDNMKFERSASPRLPSTGQGSSTTKIKAIVDIVDVNDYCKNDKGIISTEKIQNTKNDKITRRTIQKNEEDASNDDNDKNSIASDISTSDRPGAFAIQGRKTNNNDTFEDGIVQYSTTEEVETATQNQQEEAEAGKSTINDPLEAERVLETVQGVSITLDDQNDSTGTKWKQLTIILSIFVFMLCVVAAVLIVFFVRSNRNDNQSISITPTPPEVATVASPSPTDLPTFDPSTIPSAAPTSVQQQIITLLLEYFSDLPASNDQQQALDWILADPTSLGIIIEDEGMTSANKKRLILDRFVLATIYFATNGIGWSRNTYWLSPLFVCQWHDITCELDATLEQREVNEIDLSNNRLSGSIPTGVGLMTSMEFLDLRDNDLSGSIPTELGFMTSMTYLYLSENSLSGSIPTEFGLLTNTTRVYLHTNALSGSIPTELGFMTSMTGLDLNDNALTGSIPTELGLMTGMKWLTLNRNALSGSIPTELGLMTSMTELFLGGNALSGSIPTELGFMTSIKFLDLTGNSNLSGTIPSEVVALLPNLLYCFMGDTGLIGVPENCRSTIN